MHCRNLVLGGIGMEPDCSGHSTPSKEFAFSAHSTVVLRPQVRKEGKSGQFRATWRTVPHPSHLKVSVCLSSLSTSHSVFSSKENGTVCPSRSTRQRLQRSSWIPSASHQDYKAFPNSNLEKNQVPHILFIPTTTNFVLFLLICV